MELNEIKEYLEANKENPEVLKYLDQIADKRVNTALAKAEAKYQKDIDQKIETEITARADRDRASRARIEKIETLFTEKGLDETYKELGFKLLGEIGADTEEVLESKLTETLGTVQKLRFSNSPPKVGSGNITTDKDVQSFRTAMGLTTAN